MMNILLNIGRPTLTVGSFYGGHERGACLQFTHRDENPAQLTANDVDRLIIELRNWRSALEEQRRVEIQEKRR